MSICYLRTPTVRWGAETSIPEACKQHNTETLVEGKDTHTGCPDFHTRTVKRTHIDTTHKNINN